MRNSTRWLVALLAISVSGCDPEQAADSPYSAQHPNLPDAAVTSRFALGEDVMVTETKYRELPAPDCGSCEYLECGEDNCGNPCGSCAEGWTCTAQNTCIECVPDCEGKQCGDNGCQNVCGTCGYWEMCVNSQCVNEFGQACTHDSDCKSHHCVESPFGGKVCTKTCTGNCGPGWTCKGTTPGDALCVPTDCIRQCGLKTCGSDGCGGQCGFCLGWNVCNELGHCYYPCEGECAGKDCGQNSCGHLCGECEEGEYCDSSNRCMYCQNQCPAPGTSCEGDKLSTCTRNSKGCLELSLSDCPSKTHCESGACLPGPQQDSTDSPETTADTVTSDTGHEPKPTGSSGGCAAGSPASAHSAWLLLLCLPLLAFSVRLGRRERVS